MEKKRCLFCSEIVPIEVKGEFDRYLSCNCSPGSYYSLLRDNYAAINALSYSVKNKRFPIISGYIREHSDCGERVTLTIENIETIENAPTIPVSVEDKEARLLQYVYRNSEAPGEAVVIQPLANNYNLTYSPNLQELVYIIEKLREAQLLNREGMTFTLTEKGWNEAAVSAGGRKLKSSYVLLPDDQGIRKEWTDSIFPKIEQSGFLPRLFQQTEKEGFEAQSLSDLSDSKLIFADITYHAPEVYLAAGYALGRSIPVIWTMKNGTGADAGVHAQPVRPLMWDNPEDLASMLQQRLVFKD